MRSRVVAGPCPGLDCCRAGARKCRTRSGDGAKTRIRRAGDSKPSSRRRPCLPDAAHAQSSTLPLVTDYLAAFAALERHELAALVLSARRHPVRRRHRDRAVAHARARRARACGPAGRDQRAARGARPRQCAAAFRAAGDRGVAGRRRRAGDHRRRVDRDRARRCRAACSPSGPGSSPTRRRRSRTRSTALRDEGKSFSQTLTTLQHRHVAVEGRAIGGRAVLRIKDLTGAKSELAELAADHQQLRRDIDTVGRLLEALPSPVWARDATGRLTWVNAAYARAVEARDGARCGRAQPRNPRSGGARDARARTRTATSSRRGCR